MVFKHMPARYLPQPALGHAGMFEKNALCHDQYYEH